MTNCKKTPYEQFIAKPEINFWLPIIFTAVSITMSFMVLSNQVSLQNQKLDRLITDQSIIIQEYKNVQVRLGTAERDISILKSNQEIVLKNLGFK